MAKIQFDGVSGVPIDTSKIDIVLFVDQIANKLREINKASDYKIWGFRERAIYRFSFLTGSLLAYYNNDLPYGYVCKDIDVMFPQEHVLELKYALTELGYKHRTIGTVVHALIPMGGDLRQFDFERKPFKDNEPTEWAEFSNDWNVHDINDGIKGGFHKMLLMSMTAAWDEIDCLSMAYGIRLRESTLLPYETNMETIMQRLFLRNSKDPEDIRDFMETATEYSKIFHFEGTCELIKQYIPEEKIPLIVAKYERKMKERKFDEEQVEKTLKMLKEIVL